MQSIFIDDTMSVAEIAAEIDKMNKIKSIKLKYQDKIKYREDGRCYVYIKRKQIVAPSEPELYGKLYDMFYGQLHMTMEMLFPEFLRWHNNNSPVKGETLKNYKQTWERLFKDKEIVKIPLPDLKIKDFIHLYTDWTKKREMTSKAFNNSKSIINGIYKYAINELEIVDTNIAKNISSNQFPFKQVNNDEKVFTLDDRDAILDYLSDKDDIYSLAIRFYFYLPLRIGELLALKWESLDGNKLRINSQRTMSCEMNDDLTFTPKRYKTVNQTKGFHEKGIRYVLLCDKALNILKEIKEKYHGDSYIFVNNKGQNITVNTFNRKLKKTCKELGIVEYSSHKIRFCVASLYYQMGMPINKIQNFLGHSTVQMTMRYLRDVMTDDVTENIIAQL